MNVKEILTKLQDEKYPLALIAVQTGVPYMRIYRHDRDGAALTEEEQAKIKAFAYVQPCFTRES